jgi:hypothetical protein
MLVYIDCLLLDNYLIMYRVHTHLVMVSCSSLVQSYAVGILNDDVCWKV